MLIVDIQSCPLSLFWRLALLFQPLLINHRPVLLFQEYTRWVDTLKRLQTFSDDLVSIILMALVLRFWRDFGPMTRLSRLAYCKLKVLDCYRIRSKASIVKKGATIFMIVIIDHLLPRGVSSRRKRYAAKAQDINKDEGICKIDSEYLGANPTGISSIWQLFLTWILSYAVAPKTIISAQYTQQLCPFRCCCGLIDEEQVILALSRLSLYQIWTTAAQLTTTDYNSRQLIEAGVIIVNVTQAVLVSCGWLSARDS